MKQAPRIVVDQMSEPAAADGRASPGTEILSDQSPSLGPLLAEIGGTLLISTYQAGKMVVARHQNGVVATDFLDARRPMGVAIGNGQMALGVQGEILFYQDVETNCAKLEPAGMFDACFQQRYAHLTGQIDIHEMAFGADGQIWFINTRFSALCTLSGSTSFAPLWRPAFISSYAPEDRCHLNGLGLRDGLPRYVTALGETDKPAGWRERKADGGVLIDLDGNRTICRGLSMPHSPRWHANRLWICESGKGLLSTVDPATGLLTTVAELPGFTRGLDFAGPYAFVGLSQIRETATFSGIPIAEKASERNCGVWVIDVRTGQQVGALRFTQGVQEIFSVQLLHGIRCPKILAKDDKIALESYFLPSETLKDVRLTPAAAPTPAVGA
jgi:uncharacterized protein (TIGR03032 family)